MNIIKYNNFIFEDVNYDKVKKSLKEDDIELKLNLIELIENNIKIPENENVNLKDIDNFINDYLSSGKDANMIGDLTEDVDIFNFYLKFESEINETLNDSGYMDKTPKENNVFSLYDMIIDGTKESILIFLKNIKNELFK